MKRFLVFEGERYYPRGGWHDLLVSCDTIEEARAAIFSGDYDEDYWSHIVDTATGTIIETNQETK
jgi:hypothetical protein